jgi:hypothetical protein
MFTPSPKNAPRELTEKELESVVAGAAAFAAMGAWARGVLEYFSKVMDDMRKAFAELTGGRVTGTRSRSNNSRYPIDVIR